MEILQRFPYSEHLGDIVKRCEELLPKTITKRAVLVGVTAGVVVYLLTKKRYKLPPGPRGWPLLGNVLEFRKATIYEKLSEWQEQYGPIITFRIGTGLMIGVNSTEAVYEALVKKQADFAGRPQSYSTQLLSDGGKSIALGDYSPTWKLHRKIATKALRFYMGGPRLEEGIERSLTKGVEWIRRQKGAINPYDAIYLIVFNILNNICFSFSCDIDDDYYKEMKLLFDTSNQELGNGFLEDFIPPLRLWPTKKFRKFVELFDVFFGHISANIDKHKDSFSKDNIRDFCDAILLAQVEAMEEEDPEMMSKITDSHVAQTIGDIFGAGIDTSRFTLIWCLLYIADNPEVQTKLHKEIDEAMGSRIYPKMTDRDKLSFTDATLHEVLRIASVTPLALPHTAICDSQLGGYDIPKGSIIFINQYSMHHDPKNWKDPEVFRPERYLDHNGKMMPKPNSWLPFSAGRRVCLGESVAKPELLLLLAGILRQFKISPPAGEKLRYESKGGSFSRIAEDFNLVFESRL